MPGASEIPSAIEFEHLLAHTFPGFFSAVTLFMILDVWSAVDLTRMIFVDISSLLGFLGFVLLTGTILGVIQDGIHHSIIEDLIFDNFKGYKEDVKNLRKKCFDKIITEEIKNEYGKEDYKNFTRSYFFKKCGGPAVHQYLVKAIYCYSEFYSNTFLALLPFSLVVPFYLNKALSMAWSFSMVFAFLSFILACSCLNSSYVAYYRYNMSLYSAIMGYAGTGTSTSTLETSTTTEESWPSTERSIKCTGEMTVDEKLTRATAAAGAASKTSSINYKSSSEETDTVKVSGKKVTTVTKETKTV